MQERDLGAHHVVLPSIEARRGALLHGDDAVQGLGEDAGDLLETGSIDVEQEVRDRRVRVVEAIARGSRVDVVEDAAEVLREERAPGPPREPRPLFVTEERPDAGTVEVLDGPSAGLRADELDRAEPVQEPDVVSDPPERLPELVREALRARHLLAQQQQDAVPEWMRDRPDQSWIDQGTAEVAVRVV